MWVYMASQNTWWFISTVFLDLKTLLIRIILDISKKGTAAVFGSFYSLEIYLTVNDEEVVKLPVH